MQHIRIEILNSAVKRYDLQRVTDLHTLRLRPGDEIVTRYAAYYSNCRITRMRGVTSQAAAAQGATTHVAKAQVAKAQVAKAQFFMMAVAAALFAIIFDAGSIAHADITLAQAKPGVAHDCTRLTEPLALRTCLDRAEDQRLQPTTEQPGQPGRIPDALLKAAGPEQAHPAQERRDRRASPAGGKDAIRIDQVRTPNRSLSQPP